MKRWNVKLLISVSGLLFLPMFGLTDAHAQAAGGSATEDKPPEFPLVDENGVNLGTGKVEQNVTDLSIGSGAAQLTHGLQSRSGVFSVNALHSDSWTGGVVDGPGIVQLYGVGGGGTPGSEVQMGDYPVTFAIQGVGGKFGDGYIDSSNPSVVSHYTGFKDGGTLVSTPLPSGCNTDHPTQPGYYDTSCGSRYTYYDRDGNQYIADWVGQPNTPALQTFGSMREIHYANGKVLKFNYEYKQGAIPGTTYYPWGYLGWWRLRSITSNFGYMLHYEYYDNRPYNQTGNITTQFGSAEYLKSVTAIDTTVDNCAPLAETCTYTRQWPTVNYNVTGSVDGADGNQSPAESGSVGTGNIPGFSAYNITPGQFVYSNPQDWNFYDLSIVNSASETVKFHIKLGSGYNLSDFADCGFQNQTQLINGAYWTYFQACMADDIKSGIFGVISKSGLHTDYTYSFVAGVHKADSSGNTVTYGPYTPNNCPGSEPWPDPWLAPDGQISSVSKGGKVWRYDFCTLSATDDAVAIPSYLSGTKGVRKTVVTAPDGSQKSYIIDNRWGVLIQFIDELGRKTSFGYEDFYEPQRVGIGSATVPFNHQPSLVKHPEGNYETYTYDARGNVTSVTRYPKPGSTDAPIVSFQAGYDASCVNNYVKCNKPNWTRDANGNQTDYAYNAMGFIDTITYPADSAGVRKTKKFIYSDFATADGSLLHLLTSEIEDVTPTSQMTTSYEYDTSNHWYIKSKVVSSGGQSIRTCFKYDNLGNLISQTSPNAGLGVCP